MMYGMSWGMWDIPLLLVLSLLKLPGGNHYASLLQMASKTLNTHLGLSSAVVF